MKGRPVQIVCRSPVSILLLSYLQDFLKVLFYSTLHFVCHPLILYCVARCFKYYSTLKGTIRYIYIMNKKFAFFILIIKNWQIQHTYCPSRYQHFLIKIKCVGKGQYLFRIQIGSGLIAIGVSESGSTTPQQC